MENTEGRLQFSILQHFRNIPKEIYNKTCLEFVKYIKINQYMQIATGKPAELM